MKLAFRKKKAYTAGQVDFQRLPRHIAVILDGNGRWAQRRGLPRTAGHKAGAETFRTIATYCREIGLEHLTVYAFSTENWKRPRDEVDTIMLLLKRYLLEALNTMERDNVRLRFLGDMSVLNDELRELVDQCNAISARLTGCQCNICINYGGRAEIVHAAKMFAEDCIAGSVKPTELTENLFENYIYSSGIPSPELLIRPGGEQRLSNFLLWQCAYAEFYFTDVLWPDFTKNELHRAIAAYQQRDRRFGGVKK
ncbi:MAG: isoprenyl transferase [Oscillospiraceae bacterium]|nr:isoprenyl transferase [Oscillospiraceae bacterium]